jgi:hypothetical protein
MGLVLALEQEAIIDQDQSRRLSKTRSCGCALQFNTLSAVVQDPTDEQVRNCDHGVRGFQNLPKTSHFNTRKQVVHANV